MGGVIDAFVRAGAQVEVLCLTSGEASTLAEGLGVVTELSERLPAIRAAELQAAATALGVRRTRLLAHPDGGLATLASGVIGADIGSAIQAFAPDGLLVFDTSGVTGHPDHAVASQAAASVAAQSGLPVLGWALPQPIADALNERFGAAMAGVEHRHLAFALTIDREHQRRAIAAHGSQAVPGSILWHRLELLGDLEYLRWINSPPAAVDHHVAANE